MTLIRPNTLEGLSPEAAPASTGQRRPHVTLLYHFFHPDDVVSAQLYSQLAEGLAKRGWHVTVRPANRRWVGGGKPFPRGEEWQGISVHRVRRPGWNQASILGRCLNSIWMLLAWSWIALTARRHPQEVMIVGTDPVLGVLAALPWKWFRRTQAIHWCYDLYPEAVVAEGILHRYSPLVRLLNRLMRSAYRRCDLIAVLGPCMEQRLQRHLPELPVKTLTPWALIEPKLPPEPDQATRSNLFGEARIALLYSGSFGRAHSYEELLSLARLLRDAGVAFCFAGRGNRAKELKAAITDADTNISFAPFADHDDLEKRLTACDIHLVSLRTEWTGTVVPSKFFGALAVGRAVLFAGSAESAIAKWIRQYKVGWVATPQTTDCVAKELRLLADQPDRLLELRQRCHHVYQQHFCKARMLDRWDTELRRAVQS